MNLHGIADASAHVSSIPTQGTTPSTSSPEQTIGRESVEQGNTPAEESLNKSLSRSQKIELIQAAISRKCHLNLREWGASDLADLINYGTDGESLSYYTELLTDILVYASRPEHNQAFNKAIGHNGLRLIKKLSEFFTSLSREDHYNDYSNFWDLNDYELDDSVIRSYARQYVTGEELALFMPPDAEKASTEINDSSWPVTDLETSPVTFTDEDMLLALDRYYPGQQWPGDKRAVITNERMRAHLSARERERLSILTETPEQKEKRLVNVAVYMAINPPAKPKIDIPLSKLPLSVKPLHTDTAKGSGKPAPARKPSSPKKKA